MTTLHTIVLIVHVLIGAAIVGLVMLQRGKGADAGAAFGAGASGTVFGARGSANFLSRSTGILAALFFVTSLSLTYLGAQRRPVESVLDAAADAAVPATSPSAPASLPATLPGSPSAAAGAPAPAPQPGAPPVSPQGPATP